MENMPRRRVSCTTILQRYLMDVLLVSNKSFYCLSWWEFFRQELYDNQREVIWGKIVQLVLSNVVDLWMVYLSLLFIYAVVHVSEEGKNSKINQRLVNKWFTYSAIGEENDYLPII